MNMDTDSFDPRPFPCKPPTELVTPEEDREARNIISQVRLKLSTAVPFFGHLLLRLEPVITRQIPIAAVSRDRKLLINPDWLFAPSTTREEVMSTLAHEVLHPAMMVWARQGTRNAMVQYGPGSPPMLLWTIAHDYAINLILRDAVKTAVHPMTDPADWVPAGLVDEKFRNLSAEEIYDILLTKAEENGRAEGGEGSPLILKEADLTKNDCINGSASGDGDAEDAEAMSPAEQKAADQFWKVALVEAQMVHEQARNKGNLPAALTKFITDLLDPRVSWVDVLSRWVGENGRKADFSYRRPSRRSEAIGEVLPGVQKFGVDDIVVLWDTSGSMNGRETEILTEVIAICEDLSLSLRVICCDAAVCSDVSGVESPEDVDVRGGGGSDFRPAFDLLTEEGYEGVVVVFTDGYIDVPRIKPPHLRDCLWVIWPSEYGDRDPSGGAWGHVLVVDSDGKTR